MDEKFPLPLRPWVCAGILGSLVPLILHLPWWATGLPFFIVLFYFFSVVVFKVSFPPFKGLMKVMRLLLILPFFIFPYFFYGSPTKLDPNVILLAVLTSLKVWELHQKRDAYLVIILSLFLVMSSALYTQTLLNGIAMFALSLYHLGNLVRLHFPASYGKEWKFPFLLVGKYMLVGLPLMAFLFLAFPRIPVGLIPTTYLVEHSKIGFTDKLNLGDVRTLSMTGEVAFRAYLPQEEQQENVPHLKDLYWKGAVLWSTNGKSWFRGLQFQSGSFSGKLGPPLLLQKILLEPHGHKWLFGLDQIRHIKTPRQNSLPPYQGSVFETREVINRRLVYYASSVPASARASAEAAPPGEEEGQYDFLGLQIPRDLDPRLLQLVRPWKEKAKDSPDPDRFMVDQVLNYFRLNKFLYALTDIPRSENPISHFLFESRRGFCEYFAASLALLSRLMGLPSRVVVGYHGGEWNPLGRYFLVSQRDAHAWVEVKMKNSAGKREWVRVDPTAEVAPGRMEFGALEFWNNIDYFSRAGGNLRSLLPKNEWDKFLFSARGLVDNMSAQWELFLLSFDEEYQKTIFRQMGIRYLEEKAGKKKGTLIVIGVVFIFTLSLIWFLQWQFRRGRDRQHLLLFYYRKLQKKMEKEGIAKLIHEGPLTFQEKILSTLSRDSRNAPLMEIVREFFRHFISARYGPAPAAPDPEILKVLAQLLKKMKKVPFRAELPHK